MRDLYQKIYDTQYMHYGEAKYNRCPGVRLYTEYKEYLTGNIIDFGCGNGDTVRFLNAAGYICNGIDWIDIDNGMMVGDITSIRNCSDYETSLCIDVIEHIDDNRIDGLYQNMKQTKTQIISISNKPSWIEMDGESINVHIMDRTFREWNKIINKIFNIVYLKKIRDMQYLYICKE